MAFTYDVTELTTSQLYQVRYTIGDTVDADPLLQDEEILYDLMNTKSVLATSINCCLRLAAKFSREVDYDLGPHSIKKSQRAKQFQDLAKILQAQSLNMFGAPSSTAVPREAIFDINMMTNKGGM